MRRNVKFDDMEMDLVLDFSLDPEGGAPWRKLRPAQALASKGKLKKEAEAEVDEDELDNLLGSPSEASGGDENI